MRRALAIVGALAAGLGLGCEEERDRPGLAFGVKAPPAETPTAVEPLVVAVRHLPRELDPLGDLDPWGDRVVDDLLFEGLVERGGDVAPFVERGLAERCVVDDPDNIRAVSCLIRPNVVFHDGAPLEAQDVVYSLEYWLDPRRSASREHHQLSHMKSVELFDGPVGEREPEQEGRWVRIEFERAEPLALERLAEIKVVPRQLHRGKTDTFAEAPVGTGPYRLAQLADDRLVFEPHEQWWGEPQMDRKRLVMREVNDGARGLTLLRRGEIHVLGRVADTHLPHELGKPGMAARFRAYLYSPPRYDVLLYNFSQGLVAGPRMRAGVHHTVPRASLGLDVYRALDIGAEVPLDLHDPAELDLGAFVDVAADAQAVGGLAAPPALAQDASGREQGSSIFAQQGWEMERGLLRKNDTTLRFVLMWDGTGIRGEPVAALLKDNWKSLGLVVPSAIASWSYLSTLVRRSEFDVLMATIALHSDADLYPYFHTRGSLNYAKVSDRELDSALEAYRDAPTRADRIAAKQRVAQRLAQLHATTVLHAPARVLLASRRVSGLEWADDLPRLDRLALASDFVDPHTQPR